MLSFREFSQYPCLDRICLSEDGQNVELLNEGKWIRGRFEKNIRIDQPTHGVGMIHAHVLGRKGEEIGVVNYDGTSSHGTQCRLSQEDADALRDRGFKIKPGNIVEWLSLRTSGQVILLG